LLASLLQRASSNSLQEPNLGKTNHRVIRLI
jgi:hypothetical protein